MKTKRLFLGTVASLFLLLTFMSSCKDEDVEVIGVCPIVISTNPVNLAINVPLDQIITATFNEEMNPQSFTQTSYTVEKITASKMGSGKGIKALENSTDAAPISGTVSYSGVVATFIPSSPLSANTTYRCKIAASVRDLMGNGLMLDYVWSFTTLEPVAPMVISVDPPNTAINVALNKVLSAEFNMAMDPSTINASTFTLMDGTTPISGTVSYSGTTAMFTPSSDLILGKTYTATITTGAKNLAGTALGNNFVWTFSTGAVIAPTVIFVDPPNAAINVALDKVVSADFSVPMDPSTINTSTFTLMDGTTPVAGSVSYSGITARFTPSSPLLLGKTYTATITTGVKNVAGTAMENIYVWSFSTGDVIAPIVVFVDPPNGSVNVALDKVVSAQFSVPMDPSTINSSTFTLRYGTTSVSGTVSYSGTTARFTPSSDLLAGKTYTATITTGVKNVAGTAMEINYVWTFSTGAAIAPTVIFVDPPNGAINVALDKVVSADFSVPMDPSTINTSTFTLMDGTIPVAGTVSYSGTTARFTPSSPLLLGKTYTATITTGVKNVDGTAMVNNYVWSFSTGDVIAPIVVFVDPANGAVNVALDKILSADFSVVMDPATINTSTFTLMDGATSVAGTVSYSGTTARFTPSSPLLSGKTYIATITTGVKNVAGTAMVNNYVWIFSTVEALAPRVISVDPLDSSEDVALNKIISARFSVPMDPSTINTSTFTLMDGTTAVDGTVSYSGTTARFTPSSPLLAGTTYTATITTGAMNIAGTALENNYVWTFSTGSALAPEVIFVDPANTSANVALDKVISADFSVPMDPSTINTLTFTLMDGTTPIPGTVSYSGIRAIFTPSSPLLLGKTYTATITTGVKNVDGMAMENNYVWTFSTGAVIAPTVIFVNPLNGSVNVALDEILSADFSVPMDPSTINTSTFTLRYGTTSVSGTVSYSGTTAIFTPSSNLLSGKTYTATITTGVKNVAGTAMENNYVWTFSTGVVIAPTVISVDPLNGSSNVPLDKVVSAQFSVPMDPSTISTSTFTLMDGTTSVNGTVSYSGTTARFTPSSDLLLGKTYTATIKSGAKNVAGTAMENDYVWTFTTFAGLAPTVISVDPLNGAINVALDKVLSTEFSIPMDPSTINTSTFTLMDGTTTVSGEVSYSGTTARFTPSSDLIAGKTYIATITTGAKSVAGIALENNYVWSFSTVEPLAPTVISVDPLNAAVNVALDKVVSAQFSVAMDPATISTLTFRLMDGATTVAGDVSYSGTTARFTPSSDLLSGKTYTATITTGVKNVAGTAMENNYVWTFSTGAALAPTVILVDPLNAAIDVAFDKIVSAQFSVAMDPATISTSTFTLMDGTTSILGEVSYSGTTARFTPSDDLPAGKTLTATITTGAKNVDGTALENDYVWSFNTQFTLTVIAVNGTVDIDPIKIGYNNGDEVELTATGNSGYSFDSWSGDATGIDNPLIVIMDENKTITANFTENEPLGPGAIDLGTAGDFAILTKTGISTINTTSITGHIGVSPAAATAITGFSLTMDPSGEFSTSIYVSGNVYASDYAVPTPSYVSTAISDQETAFTTAMGLTTDVINNLGAGDISGMTLAPGLYKWSTGLLITNQGVTLSGGPKDTWVFQIADDFTIANDAKIVLAGGALAKNIFWITSTQGLLGSNVEFHGNLLAQTLISLTSGTTVYGRLLSQTAVTLDGSIVVKPTD